MKRKEDEQKSIEFPEQKIVDVAMHQEVAKSFLEYSMSVIVSRALPDVRDGMKPGQRRILYAMYEDNLTYNHPFRKSATTVGNVLGRYHPHGDAAVYGTMVRMAQSFNYRYPLVEGHGNFGNVDGDGAAAYRYTEARMSRIADDLLRDIEKDTIPWDRNFDNTRREPSVLPCRFPNFLVNGAVGIAVGMATNVPPHNLGEVIDGTVYLMEHPDASIADLMQFIKGPDFPTGATVYGTNGIAAAYHTGNGRIRVRAKATVDEEKRRIVITEIPYMVNKSLLIESMAQQVRNKKVEGVTELRDESGRDGMKIVIEYRRDANGQVILNQFYKYTQLEDTCAVNMLALVNGIPKILDLKQILNEYIRHQESVITNRTKFDLDRALKEAHIYEGYKIAVDNIDAVIKIIRASADVNSAKLALTDAFGLSDAQSAAIVAMTLGRLSGMERLKIEQHLEELRVSIEEYRAILADETKIKEIIKTEMLEIKERFADERRTGIEEAVNDIVYGDLVTKEDCVVTMTAGGYVKRLSADTYTAQNRGGKGMSGITTKDDDVVYKMAVVFSHATLLMFTNLGKVYARRTYDLPDVSRTAKGSHIRNILPLAENETVTSMLAVPDDFPADKYLVMVTRGGRIKRTSLAEYKLNMGKQSPGKIALNLLEGDELIFTGISDGTCDIMIASKQGRALRISEEKVRPQGRTASGVIGMRISGEDNEIVSAAVLPNTPDFAETHKVLTVSEYGVGKKFDMDEINAKGRGGQGVLCHKISEKAGMLAALLVVSDEEDVVMNSASGNVIRTPANEIALHGRATGGVKLMRLDEGDRVISADTVAVKVEISEEELEELRAETVLIEEDADDSEKIVNPRLGEGESEE